MIFDLKLIQNETEFKCECGNSIFIAYDDHINQKKYACDKCHTTFDAEICALSEVEV